MSERLGTAREAVSGAAVRDALDGRWADVRRSLRDRAPAAWSEVPADIDRETHRERVLQHLRELAASGEPQRGFAAEVGGRGDVGGGVTAFEVLGFCDLSLMVKAGVQWGLFGGAVQSLGTEEHHRRYLPSILSLDLLGCFAMTETGHGSDVQSLRTTATYDPDREEIVVHTPDEHARKDYIGNAARDGRMAVVFAQLVTPGAGGPHRHGVHAVLVPIRDEAGHPLPGVTIEDCGGKAGLGGVDNGRLTFDHVRVPRTALLDRYGHIDPDGSYTSPIDDPSRRFFTMLGTLVRGRISVGGAAGSAAKTALAIAVRYAEARRQFARPGTGEGAGEEVLLLDYLSHQRRLLPALASSYALHFAQGQLVEMLDGLQSGDGSVEPDAQAQRELESRAAGLKALTTWHASQTIQACREACGGAGYLAENRLPQLRADIDVFTTFEGDNTVLLQLVAKGLLTSYREGFGDLDALGVIRFVTQRLVDALAERTAARGLARRVRDVASGRAEDQDVRDRSWHLDLVRDREEHLLETLALRLRRARQDGEDAFAVFNAAQDHLLLTARAHVDRVVLEAFVVGVEQCADPAVGALLSTVCDLHALSRIESERAWYLEHGRMTPARSKLVVAAVNELCRELRPHALTLVEGFGIPEGWLSAPIATGAEQRRQELAR